MDVKGDQTLRTSKCLERQILFFFFHAALSLETEETCIKQTTH